MIRLFVLLFCAVTLCADEPATAFDAANRAYEKGDYAAALSAYEKIVANGKASAALLFNLGNAYYKNGQLGHAIVAYRKAHQFAPRDPDIRANLRYVAGNIPGNDSRRTSLESAAGVLTLNERGALSALALWLCFGSLAVAQFRPALKEKLRSLITISGVAAILFGGWYSQGLIARATDRRVVVINATAPVRFGPLEESQISFNVRDGNELKLLGKKDQWLQVADASNRSGWILQSDVEQLP